MSDAGQRRRRGQSLTGPEPPGLVGHGKTFRFFSNGRGSHFFLEEAQ